MIAQSYKATYAGETRNIFCREIEATLLFREGDPREVPTSNYENILNLSTLGFDVFKKILGGKIRLKIHEVSQYISLVVRYQIMPHIKAIIRRLQIANNSNPPNSDSWGNILNLSRLGFSIFKKFLGGKIRLQIHEVSHQISLVVRYLK